MKIIETEKEKELIEELTEMVLQHCSSDEYLDSMAFSSNASAMRLLSEYGVINIISQSGRRIIAKYKGSAAHANNKSNTPLCHYRALGCVSKCNGYKPECYKPKQ